MNLDYWPAKSFDFDRVFRKTVNPKGINPEVAQVRQELNEFKEELKPWLQEIAEIRMEKLKLLKEFVELYIVIDPEGRLNVKQFNPMFVKFVKTTSGMILEPNTIKGLMESLFNKSKDDGNFWYKGHRDCFYRGLRWRDEIQAQYTNNGISDVGVGN